MGLLFKKTRIKMAPSDDVVPSKRAAEAPRGLTRQKMAALGLLSVVAVSLLGVFTWAPTSPSAEDPITPPSDGCFEYYFTADSQLEPYRVGHAFIIRDLAITAHFTAMNIQKPLYLINCTFSASKTLKLFNNQEVHISECTIARTLNAKFNAQLQIAETTFDAADLPLVKNTALSITDCVFSQCEMEIAQSAGNIMKNSFHATEIEFNNNFGIVVALNDFTDITSANFGSFIAFTGSGVVFGLASAYSDHILGNFYAEADVVDAEQITMDEYSAYFPTFDTEAAGIFITAVPMEYDAHPLALFGNILPPITLEVDTDVHFTESAYVNISISGLSKSWAWHFNGMVVETPTWNISVNVQTPLSVTSSGDYLLVVNATNIFNRNATSTLLLHFDLNKPRITAISPANHSTVGLPNPAYRIDIDEEHLASIMLTANGGDYSISAEGVIPAEAWAYAISQGAAEFVLTATDLGGRSESVLWVLAIDASAPEVAIIAPQAATYKNAPTFTIIANEPIILTEVRLNGLIAPAISNNSLLAGFDALSDGIILIQAFGTDMYGNPFGANQTIIKDTTPPVLVITAPSVASSAPVISVVCGDPSVDEIAVEIQFANGTTKPIGGVAPGSQFDLSGLWNYVAHEETVIIRASCMDAIGNLGSSEVGIAKDVECPFITAQSESGDRVPNGAPTLAFTITASDCSALYIYVQINDEEMILIEIGEGGLVEIPTEKFIEGMNRVQFIAIDAAENANSTTLYLLGNGNPPHWEKLKANLSDNWAVYLVGVVALAALFISLNVKKKMEAK